MGRQLQCLAVTAGLALTLVACGNDVATETTIGGAQPLAADATAGGAEEDGRWCVPGRTDGDLNLYNRPDYIDPALVSDFEDQYEVDVVETSYDSDETMLAQIQAGVVYDLIVGSDSMVSVMIDEGLLRPLSMESLPNIDNVAADFQDLPYDPDGAYSVAYLWQTTGLGVNLSVLGGFDPSWSLALDADLTAGYPGGVSLLDDPRETMGAALRYLGHSLNETSEEALREAADLIAATNVTAFDSDQYADSLVDGEVVVSHGSSADLLTAFGSAENRENWVYVIPEEGGTLRTDNMAIPADADHPCTAHTFMDFILDAENGARLANWVEQASPNQAAEEFIDPEILEDPAIYPDDETFARLEVIEDTGDAEILFTDYFEIARRG